MGWRMSQQEEEEYGMTTEKKNAVGEAEETEEGNVETERNGRRLSIAHETSQGKGLRAYAHYTPNIKQVIPRI